MGVLKRLLFLALVFIIFRSSFADTLTTFNGSLSSQNATFANVLGGTDITSFINMPWRCTITSASFDVRGDVLNVVEPPALSDSFVANNNIFINGSKLYVVDDGNHQIKRYTLSTLSSDAFTIGESGVAGNDNTHLDNPKDIFVNDTAIFVSDQDNHRIVVYNSAGSYLYELGGPGSGSANDMFYNPRGLFVDSNYIYVADSGNNRVQILDHDGSFVASISGLSSPTDIVVNDTYIYIVNSGTQTVRIYDSGLIQRATLGTSGSSGTGSDFDNPTSISVGPSHLYITDTNNHRVSIWSIDKTTVPYTYTYHNDIGIAGSAGSEDESLEDAVKLRSPQGVVVSGSYVYVSDTGLNRILKTSSSYPSTVRVKALFTDDRSDYDYSGSGTLSTSASATFNTTALQNYLQGCSQVSGNCTFTIEVQSSTGGVVYLEDLSIVYTPIIQSHFNGSLGSFGARYRFEQSGEVKTTGTITQAQSYDFYVSQGTYNVYTDLIVSAQSYAHEYIFKNVNLSQSNYNNQLAIYAPSTSAFNLSDMEPVVLAGISFGDISFTNVIMNISWYGEYVSDESKLVLYHCPSFNFLANTCRVNTTTGQTWILSSTAIRDTTNDYFSINVTDDAGIYAIVIQSLEQLYINASTSKASYLCGEKLQVSGQVRTSNNALVSGATVYFNLSNSSGTRITTLTNTSITNGWYYVNYTLPSTVTSSSGGDTYTIDVLTSNSGYVNGSGSKTFAISCCGLSYVSLCASEEPCEAVGGYWCSTTDLCQSVPCGTECSISACSACSTETLCSSASCHWCTSYCQLATCDLPSGCSSLNLGLCTTNSSCSSSGGVWFDEECYSADQTCSALYLGLCTSSTDCSTAGGQWCGTVCRSICAGVSVQQLSANETLSGEGNYSFKVSVSNQYASNMTNTHITVTGINQSWYEVTPINITLVPGDSQEFLIQIILPANDSINNYDVGYRVVSDVDGQSITSSTTTIEPTINLPPKFFATFVILNDLVTAGNRVNFRVQLLNARDDPASVNLTYRIKQGNRTVAEKTELVILETEVTFAQTIVVPTTTFQGTYTLEISADSESFSDLEEHSFNVQLPRPWIIFGFLLILAGVIVFYVFKFRGKLKQIGEIEEAYSGIDWSKIDNKKSDKK